MVQDQYLLGYVHVFYGWQRFQQGGKSRDDLKKKKNSITFYLFLFEVNICTTGTETKELV